MPIIQVDLDNIEDKIVSYAKLDFNLHSKSETIKSIIKKWKEQQN